MLNNKNIYKALGFGLVGVIGLLLLVDTFFEHQFYLKLRQDGIKIDGIVVGIEEATTSDGGFYWEYTIKYSNFHNKDYIVINKKYKSKIQRFNIGDTLQVVYDKQDPSKAVLKIELNSSFLRDYVVTVLMSCMLIVGFILYKKGRVPQGPHSVRSLK